MMIKPPHTKEIILIIIAGLTVYANVLFNDFIGDDQVFIVDNTFYTSLKNLPSLFTADYFPHGDKNRSMEANYYSGSVAYRPALSLTYFIDHFIWKLNPFGYHLTNVLLHVANMLLVYVLLFIILKARAAALMAALLFGLHPIQGEAVANIGYRADLISFFLVLSSLVSLMISDAHPKKPKKYLIFSVGLYALALFSKESSVALLFLIAGYDACLRGKTFRNMMAAFKVRYAGYAAVTIFYLFLYIVVFPNTSLDKFQWMNDSIIAHIATGFWIIALHLKHLLIPFSVHMLPPLYHPEITPWGLLHALAGIILLIIIIRLAIWLFDKDKISCFFLLWFCASILPVSNIFPNVNPIAHRYMYLPSLGLVVPAVIWVRAAMEKLHWDAKGLNLAPVLAVAIVVICASLTFTSNYQWRSNYTVSLQLITRYPEHPKGYSIAGFQYFNDGKIEEAKKMLYKSYRLGDKDPRIMRMLNAPENQNNH